MHVEISQVSGLVDPLTGVYSRGSFHVRLQEEAERSQRYGYPFSLLLLDLDHFKSINDAFGHNRGDQVLVEFTQHLVRLSRSSDLIFRFGGDEFILLLPLTDKAQAVQVAQRILESIRSTPISGKPPLALSTSIGVVCFPSDTPNPESLLEIADQRQYQAKRSGRGRVVCTEEAAPGYTFPVQPTRLIERDSAQDTLHHFLTGLSTYRRGVLELSGPAGSGQTRFLSEANKIARLLGYGVLALQGKPALKGRVFGSLADACKDWKGFPLPAAGESRLIAALQQRSQEEAEVGLLITVDHLGEVDQDTLNFLRTLFLSAAFPRIALVYIPGNRPQPWAQEAQLRAQVSLEPISLAGTRIWLRHSLKWEAPETFLNWFYQETQGLPVSIQRGLEILVEQEVIRRSSQQWVCRTDFHIFSLAGELARQKSIPVPNLPVYLTPFVGREEELKDVKNLLLAHRLVAVVGSPGVGKTRLANQITAESAESFPNGVGFISLAALNTPNLLVYALAEALHLPFRGPQDAKTQLLSYLRSARHETLIVLDGFEHLHGDTGLIVDILAHAPDVRFLITSREHLGLPAGATYYLEGLLFPGRETGQGLEEFTAMQLFLRNAQLAQPNFVLTEAEKPYAARICNLVGGIPFLIELAAAWVRAFSCQEIAARIVLARDEESRTAGGEGPDTSEIQGSMRAVFASLWKLVSSDEQQVLSLLSVFQGGFSEEAARQVANASPFFLDALIAKTYLYRANPGHYVLHQLLRQFVAEKLQARPQLALQAHNRHCRYYTSFVQKRQRLLPGERRGLVEISAEIENVRAAWNWAAAQGCLAELENCLDGLARFYDHSGRFQEAETLFASAAARLQAQDARGGGAARLQTLVMRLQVTRVFFLNRQAAYQTASETAQAILQILPAGGASPVEAAVYLQYGRALWGLGDYVHAWENMEHALQAAHAHRQEQVATDCLCDLGELCLSRGDQHNALTYYQQALHMYRKIDDRRGEGRALNNLGVVHKNLGNYADSRDYFDQALSTCRAIGDRRGEGQALNNLGHISQHMGQFPAGRSYYDQALVIYREIGDRQGESWGLNSIGFSLFLNGEYEAALTYYTQALRLSRGTGDRWGENIALFNLGSVYMTMGCFSQAEPWLLEALRLCQGLGDKWGEVWRLAHLGLFNHSVGKNGTALEYCSQALQLAQELGDRPMQAKVHTYLGHILAALGCLDEARSHYEQGLSLRRALQENNLALEALAGLARVAMAMGNLPHARQLVAQILSGGVPGELTGAEDPLRVHITCYQVLAGEEGVLASQLLKNAHDLLLARADGIGEQSVRHSYLWNVPSHREVMQAWEKNSRE